MLFNSYEFIFLFLPITLIGFYSFARVGFLAAASWLSAASLFFYAWWSPQYTLLLIGSIAFNYASGYTISHQRNKLMMKAVLAGAVAADIGLLAYFKYANFFISAVNDLSGVHFGNLDVLLPLGISFFTFTQIAFLVDVYRGIAREHNFVHYALFVTYFPHLIAGPVLHHKEMMPQFDSPNIYRMQFDSFAVGLTIFVIGLAKKVLIADSFSDYATRIFDGAAAGSSPSLIPAWAGALAYTFQIYFDFSGYSDMAIGLSRLFGIKLPLNFNSPYKATNIIEFWRRWHMTLSRFLRDYLYFPLGGNRFGVSRRFLNLMITMILGGLWHGANWTFVVWGALHGGYLVINHAWRHLCQRMGIVNSVLPRLGTGISWLITFIAIVVAWVFFRASNLQAAVSMLEGMAGLNGIILPERLSGYLSSHMGGLLSEIGVRFSETAFVLDDNTPLGVFDKFAILSLVAALLLCAPNSQQLMQQYEPALGMIGAPARGIRLGAMMGLAFGSLFFLCLLTLNRKSEFLYFQF